MQKGNVSNWELDGSEDAELFFAQRMNELLFDYTLDSNKYYALNISLLLTESLKRISKVDGDLTKDENLKSIIEETNLKAQSDIITKEILGSQYNIFFPIKLSNNRKQEVVKIELLSNRLSLGNVIEVIFKLLPIKIENNSKQEVNLLANNLVTALINVGFHQSYIYHETNNFFFTAKKKENRTLLKYFDLFAPKKKEYKVIVKVSNSFLEIKDLCKDYDLELVVDVDLQDYTGKSKAYLVSKNDEQIFAICEKIWAYDTQSARIEAVERLNSFAGIFTYFHHKNPPNIERAVIVELLNKKFVVEPAVSPMIKGEDMSHKDAGEFLKTFFKTFRVGRATTIRFNRAVNLHSQALTTISNENRILNLWISYETLFGGGQTTTVIHIINSLEHICSLNYFDRIFIELAKSVKKWNKKELDKIKTITNCESDEKAICAFIVCKEFEIERSELFKLLGDFPLLRFRIFDLNKKLNTPKKILTYLEQHNVRIRWHIKRLYRTRNQIVHDGYSPRNLEILIENAHTYFDIFMDEFIIDNMLYKTTKTIEQAVTNYELLDNSWQKELKDLGDIDITKSNFERAILYKKFGR